jgi:hypothetical protein
MSKVKEKEIVLNNFLSKGTWLSDKKFPSSNVDFLKKEFKKKVLKED